jgi:4-hydroxy-tetrahydrodipicolinate reductase
MKIAILGYGKMGEQIEEIALEKNYEIVAYIDDEEDWKKFFKDFLQAEVAIDFSNPDVVVDNIYKCFENNIPVVVGTTAWYDRLDEVKQKCEEMNQTLFYATNFSLGVNLFFELNRVLAQLMNGYEQYDVSIEETHHTAKQDSPSGTAIVLANDIIKHLSHKETWINEINDVKSELSIKSQRVEDNIGTHTVTYTSVMDEIEIKHTSFHRKSFAVGAVMAAEWILGKKGVYNMKDIINLKLKE